MRRILTLLVALCALSLMGQSGGVTTNAGVHLTGGGSATNTALIGTPNRVVDAAYAFIGSTGLRQSAGLFQDGGKWPPAPSFDDTYSGNNEVGWPTKQNQYVTAAAIDFGNYTDGTTATGPRFFNASVDSPLLEGFVCRRKSAVLSSGAGGVTTGTAISVSVSGTPWTTNSESGRFIRVFGGAFDHMLEIGTNSTNIALVAGSNLWTDNGSSAPASGDSWEVYEAPRPCSNGPGAECIANVTVANDRHYDLIFEDTRPTPHRWHVASVRASNDCSGSGTDVWLNRFLEIPGTPGPTDILVEPMMWNFSHFSPSWWKLLAQWIRELPKSMTTFPSGGGMALNGNVNEGTVNASTGVGSWTQKNANGSFFSTQYSVGVPDNQHALHGTALFWVPSTDATGYVRLGPFANVEDSPGGTDEDNDNYFAAHGIVDCADGPTEIWVRDEVASTDYTIAGAGQSSPLSANVYRVYYYDYDQGWIAAPTDGGTGHPHIPSCSTEDLAFLGGAQVPVVVTIGIDESASAQEFYVAFNPRDRFNADSQFNRLSVDEWYVHPKEDPTMDLVLAFPSPLSASLLGDSNYKEHLWSSGPTNCTTATMDGSRRCGHLMWAMQEIGPLAIGDDSYNLDTAATAGFELCNQFDTGGTEFATMADSVNADYGFHGSLMNALLANPAKTVKSYVFVALGENDNGKPSALEKCFDRVREKIRKAGAVPVFLTQPHYWGDTNVTPRTPEAGGSTQFDLWWDEFMVRMILDGTFYAGVPAVGDSAQ